MDSCRVVGPRGLCLPLDEKQARVCKAGRRVFFEGRGFLFGRDRAVRAGRAGQDRVGQAGQMCQDGQGRVGKVLGPAQMGPGPWNLPAWGPRPAWGYSTAPRSDKNDANNEGFGVPDGRQRRQWQGWVSPCNSGRLYPPSPF